MVSQGEATTLTVALTAGLLLGLSFPAAAHDQPHEEPWVETGEWVGFISCAIRVADTSYPCVLYDGNHHTETDVTAAADLRTVTAALTWDSWGSFSADEMRLTIHHGAWSTSIEGSSPLELRLDDAWDASDPTEFTFEVAPLDPFVFQQPFTVYTAFHYVEPAPAGYTALPDS